MTLPAPVRVEDLYKRFRRQVAVDHVGFEVPTGSIFGLLGENGAGKTTIIQLLLGLLRADGGTVDTLGLDPGRHGLEVRRRVGYVPELPTLYDWMTPAEIGWFAAGFHDRGASGSAGYLARYRDHVAHFAVPADRKIKHVSKGMRAKVALALALASEPELLVLDEPTSGLDVLVRREFLGSMVELAGEGRTILLSSHQISEVERVASHVALLHQGKLILAEPLDDLKARTHLVSLTLAGSERVAIPAGLPVELIDADEAARQAHWLVHAASALVFERLRELPGVVDVTVETPTLEEIYVGYMKRRVPAGSPPPRLSVQVA